MADSPNPGDYKLTSAILSNYEGTKTYDISNIIYGIEVNESIDDFYITGRVSVVDTNNFLDNFPIIGEESLNLAMTDFFGEEYIWTFRITSVSPVKVESVGAKLDYSLNVVSANFLKADNKEIRRSFKGTPSEIAQEVFDQYFDSEMFFDVEEATSSQTFVIPSKTPFETMEFLARKSHSLEFPSSTFKFFETRNDFKFVTMEGLIKKGKNKKLDEKRNLTYIDPKILDSDPAVAMRNMISYTPVNRFNLLEEMRQGGMVSEITLLDLAEKTVEEKIYKHYEEVGTLESTDKKTRKYHTNKFIEDNFQKENALARYIVYNDTSKPDQYYDQILPKRLSTEYYMNSIGVQIETYGSFDIELGDIVYLNLPKAEVARDAEEHETLSGWYLVRKMRHEYGIDDWKINYLCVKTALKGGYE